MGVNILWHLICFVTIAQASLTSKYRRFSNHDKAFAYHTDRQDPEVYMNVTELLTSKGYPCEEYTAKTADGYLLGVQRVPHGKDNIFLGENRPVVYLQHGLLSSADDWADNLVNQSLVFLLADAGFDVWMGNSRGNTYSLKHVKYKPSQQEFWDFSSDEMAKYDLPASVDLALRVSGARDLVYVGFSQGTEIAFAQLSTDTVLASKIKLLVALAPVAFLSNMKSPIKDLAPFSYELRILFRLLGVKDFLPSSPLIRWLGRHFCSNEIPDILCLNVMFLFGGYDSQQMNTGVMSGKFQMFDYGACENRRRYNQSTPPQYDLSRIDVPVALYSGTADWLADPDDVTNLVSRLKTVIKHKVIKDWEHLDFIWGMDSPTVCYNDVINLIKKVNNIA